MTTTSPAPFPEDGIRKLSLKESLQRAKALACTLPQSAMPTCSGQVFVGIFFDGTGNNMKADYNDRPPEQRKHSNVVKLFQTYPDFRQKPGHYSFYIPGVGTRFPEIGDQAGKLFNFINPGAAGAEKGEHRIIWAFTRLLNAPHRYVLNNAPLISDQLAKTIVDNVASTTQPGAIRRVVLRQWQDKLKAALDGKKPRIDLINLSVFGFSRGAAQARAFANWLFEVCEPDGGGWSFAGIPIRLQFLGLFDTVASVGIANLHDNGILAGHQSWADDNLQIHPAVEQCVHYVAGHEIRACFPLDSVRVKSSYPANAIEVMYPGAHSDVGGGYAPNDLGVSPTQPSFLSIIPGVNMYHEARKAGVPLRPFDELLQSVADGLTPQAPVIQDFNAYLQAAKIGSGPVEDVGRKHMALYFSYRFKHVHASSFYGTSPYRMASATHRSYLYKTQRTLFMQLNKLVAAVTAADPQSVRTWPFLRNYGATLEAARRSWDELVAPPSIASAMWNASSLGRLVAGIEPTLVALGKGPMEHALEVAQRIRVEDVSPAVETFFERYVHDSQAGFIDMGMDEYNRNGIGFVKFRTVFKGND